MAQQQLHHLLSFLHCPPTRRHLHVMWTPPSPLPSPPWTRGAIPSLALFPSFAGNWINLTPHLELEDKSPQNRRVNGVYFGYFFSTLIRGMKALYLYHDWPAWYQFVTATFCHADGQHLSSNLFFVYIFGKLVKEEEGNLGLWISYILTGAGGNFVSWLILPQSAVSLGASDAVFGLFAISVLVKMSWDWRKIIEVLILCQFVIDKVMKQHKHQQVLRFHWLEVIPYKSNHIAHLSGALIGAALVLLIG